MRRASDNPVIFVKDGVRQLAFDAELAAKLIHLSQRNDGSDYVVELNPARPLAERKKNSVRFRGMLTL